MATSTANIAIVCATLIIVLLIGAFMQARKERKNTLFVTQEGISAHHAETNKSKVRDRSI